MKESGPYRSEADPSESEEVSEETWFSVEELARLSTVRLGERPEPDSPFDPEILEHVDRRGWISLSELPTWPSGPDQGHGLGTAAAAAVGPIGPGMTLAISASESGVGRSSLLTQVAVGLALREGPRPSPVVLVNDMARAELAARTLARWTGHDPRLFRFGRAGGTGLYVSAPAIESILAQGRAALAGPLSCLRTRLRHVSRPDNRGTALAEALPAIVDTVTRSAAAEAGLPIGDVCPVLVLDDLDELCGIEDVELTRRLAAFCRRQAGVLVLADTDLSPRVARIADVSIELSSDDDEPGLLHLDVQRRVGPAVRATLMHEPSTGRVLAP